MSLFPSRDVAYTHQARHNVHSHVFSRGGNNIQIVLGGCRTEDALASVSRVQRFPRIPSQRIHTHRQIIKAYDYLHPYSRVSGETVRPRHDLSHPARTKKQIDASSHYNSPSFSLSLSSSLRRLYPPGIARQIKHHLLSERVDPSTPSRRVASTFTEPSDKERRARDLRRLHRRRGR